MRVVRPFRPEIEGVWRDRLTEALERYRIAKLDARTALIQKGEGEMPTPDGNFAFRKALQLESMALAEYKRILIIFTDLVLNGNGPPDV